MTSDSENVSTVSAEATSNSAERDVLRVSRTGHMHWCPGCKSIHILPPGWTFNGDLRKPTFSPSFKHTWRYGDKREPRCCHYVLTDGVLNFCSDSTHSMAGQAVPLPLIPAEYDDFDKHPPA